MNQILSDFFWLRPMWLTAVPILILWIWYLSKQQGHAGWKKYISKHSLDHLRSHEANNRYYWTFAVPLVISCVALAGPSLTSIPSDTANSQRATVLILDLSPSMLAQDINPNRLTQARYKLIDLLRQHDDGEIALVVYSADAYRVTPLTDDPATIEALVPTLEPDIMPARGSNIEEALRLAADTLNESEATTRQVILITDGIDDDAFDEIERSTPETLRISILAVGTSEGATIPTESGVLTDQHNAPVIASLNVEALRRLTKRYGGRFTELTNDSTDTLYLSTQPPAVSSIIGSLSVKEGTAQFDQYQDLGFWLLPVLLLCAIWAFRKNFIYSILPIAMISPEAESFEWQDLWSNQDQQALDYLSNNNNKKAQSLFTRPRWQAIAAYRGERYLEAIHYLSEPVYAEDLYNRGNAQALSGNLDAALKSYNQALLLYSEDQEKKRTDTVHNINVIKRLIGNEDDQDDGPYNARGNSSGNAQASDSSAENEPSLSASEGQQSQIGGATGPGQSLDQQALQQQGSAESIATPDQSQETKLASDANVRNDQLPADKNKHKTTASPSGKTAQATTAESNNSVLSPYSEQWLRDLPQDPGGYLRRKFQYQYQTRQPANRRTAATTATTTPVTTPATTPVTTRERY